MMKTRFLMKIETLFIILLIISTTTVSAVQINQKTRRSNNIVLTCKTWYVPDDFPTIKKAVESEKVKDGDTIFVRSGIYNERIQIKKRINLIGENKETTIIECKSDYGVVIVDHDCVKISGFTIKDKGNDLPAWGAISLWAKWCNITDNIIESSHGLNTGIYLIHASNNVIKGNTLKGKSSLRGIYLDGMFMGEPTPCIENTITENTIIGYANGIELVSVQRNTIKNNLLRGGTDWSSEDGIDCYRSDGNKIIGNSISNFSTESHESTGIDLYGSHRVEIKSNTISYNNIGIQIRLCKYDKKSLLEDNTFEKNDKDIVIGRGRYRNLFTSMFFQRILLKIILNC